ncbi:hypothetical protein [Acidipropionibacterium virtanenii]|uniref:Uncharacterized protein n=1 Tax=Acidipropionibacterium virtanenii TaxID=2057246 RepID=A0A344UT47_9ACTN|nr:hypothetical protein [Acidipropionibacterium virtanenii]AXE38445.1 hypothetical protein JS278_01269 [Acidipropionibacterium virtanenii]
MPSTLGQVQVEIEALKKEIKSHQELLSEFLRKNKDNMQLVSRELEGSSTSFDVLMMNAMTKSETDLRKAQDELRVAADALDKVRL